jgi:DNA-binding CsgD family transcriptional regulator/DNA-binding transcriptional ArsR family regulator
VVFVDDAHFLDDGSATLLHQLALAHAATVVATVRTGTPVPDPVVALWKDGPAERIEVAALSAAAVEEILVTVLGGPVDTATLRRLSEHCRGSPLFLRELVTGALETSALVDEGGLWRLRGALRPTGRLVELVALRLGELSGPEWAVLELLTLGEPLGQAALGRLADPGSVDALEDKGLVTSRIDGRRAQVWLGHPVYGDVVRSRTSALRKRALARARAEEVEATGARRRGDTLLVASLRLVGGGGSAELLLAGAIAARARHDHPLAERLARAAMGEGARFIAAEAAQSQGRAEQAEDELAALALEATGDAERARVALLRFDNAYFGKGRAEFGLVDDVVAGVADPFWRQELVARRLYVTTMSDGPRAVVEAASALAEGPGPGPITSAHAAVHYSLVRVGRFDSAAQLAGRLLDIQAVPASDEPWEHWSLFSVNAVALVCAGRLGQADELLTRAYDQVADEPAAEARAFVAVRLAFLYLEQGRVQSAFRLANEGYTLFQQLGRPLQARWGYIFAVQALAQAGQAERAARTLAAFDALGLPRVLLTEADLLQARGWTAAAAGDLPAARARLQEAADLGQQVGDLVGATNALHGLARLGGASQAAPRLISLAPEVEGNFVAARAAYARAVASRSSPALEKASRDFEELGALLYAAEASAEAAVVLGHAGQAGKAARAEQKAARLLACCEGATTPAVQAITARVSLTPPELDAAYRAAAGRSNKQIAADMYLSVRTVESHLQRAYEKLGVSGRHELADALGDQPSPNPGGFH